MRGYAKRGVRKYEAASTPERRRRFKLHSGVESVLRRVDLRTGLLSRLKGLVFAAKLLRAHPE